MTAAAGATAAAAECDVCRTHGDAALTHLEALRTPRWVVRHHGLPAPMVGWTLLCAARHVQGAADFLQNEADEYGVMARSVSVAVRKLTGCDRVYMIAFGQGAPHLHAHLIPRFDRDDSTRAWAVADFYRAVEAGERPAADPERVAEFIAGLRQELRQDPNVSRCSS